MKFHSLRPYRFRSAIISCVAALVLVVTGSVALAGGQTCSDPEDSPDVIVGNLHQVNRYGPVGDVTAYAIGTVSCNIGTCWLNWFSGGSNQHPTIGQNMFRLKDGRFEQLGQSWLKHGFFALSQGFCFNDCQSTGGTHLGVHCSDPYSAGLNGDQDNLGPKFEVNASTGFHPHPVTDIGNTGNSIFKRVQVHNDDLDPAMNPGALYFIEGHYIAEDDAEAGNGNNNASYRKVFVSAGAFNLSFDGPTQQQQPAIQAWQDYDTGVDLVDVEVPNDGLFIVGTKVTDLGGGMWHYEYAVQNLTSHRSALSFSVPYPIGATLQNVEFHDVAYHSGEPFDGTPWTHNSGAGGELRWSTTPFAVNADANALRWGTLYNFRFDPCNCAVDCGEPTPSELSCNDLTDNDCDLRVDCDDSDCCADGFCAPDFDGDSYHGCADCNDLEGDAWSQPGEATSLILSKSGGDTVYTWSAPAEIGGNVVTYELLRTTTPDFWAASTCLVGGDPSLTTMADSTDPAPDGLYSYLPRALNTCPADSGEGSIGSNTAGIPRKGRCN